MKPISNIVGPSYTLNNKTLLLALLNNEAAGGGAHAHSITLYFPTWMRNLLLFYSLLPAVLRSEPCLEMQFLCSGIFYCCNLLEMGDIYTCCWYKKRRHCGLVRALLDALQMLFQVSTHFFVYQLIKPHCLFSQSWLLVSIHSSGNNIVGASV